MKKATNSFLFFIFVLFACEEPFQSKNESMQTDLIVVEGVITNEKRNHEVSLSRIYLNQNGLPAPVSGAAVSVSAGDSIFSLIETPAGSGKYRTPPMRAAYGKTYKLTFTVGDQTYTAEDSPLPVEPMPDVVVDKQPEGYKLMFRESGQGPNYIDHYLDWRGTDDCPGAGCEGRIIFYDLKTIDVNDIYKPEKTDLYFPKSTVIIRRKYSVSPRYRDFLRSMLMETEWRGGVFDVERANVPTNLSAGAIGFFAVSTVVSDTTIVE